MKVFLIIVLVLIALYALLCTLLYTSQEGIVFHPQKLSREHVFQFNQPFEERNITMKDGTVLNGLLFKADSSKGVIFYLHGNAGSLDSWGYVADVYTELKYDVFMLDYRGYGKSGGKITDEAQLHSDVQTVYDLLVKEYTEDRIVVLGYSIGTGMASKVAAENKPKLLILQAPYYSIVQEMKQRFSFIPTFVLKYRLENNEHLKKCTMPVVVFHGNQDGVIDYRASLKLQHEFKAGNQLITLKGEGHNGMSDNTEYRVALKRILSK